MTETIDLVLKMVNNQQEQIDNLHGALWALSEVVRVLAEKQGITVPPIPVPKHLNGRVTQVVYDPVI